MKRSTVGVILLLLLGVGGIFAYKYAQPLLTKRLTLKTSDARANATSVRVAGDGYLGYWFLRSPEMEKVAPSKGVTVHFTDDKGLYAERLEKFTRGEYDIITLPINSYLEHGAKHQFPGVIVAAVGSSRGADALVGFAAKFPKGNVKELEGLGTRIVYTTDSPSSFMLDLITSDFDLPALAGSDGWRVPVDDIKVVLERAKKRDGDAFVLWEPELSRALETHKDLKVLLSSASFDGYIVDVFVVSRDFLTKNGNATLGFFESYFATLQHYAGNREQMLDEMKRSESMPRETLDAMVKKIDWFDLSENCLLQFGMEAQAGAGLSRQEGIVHAITSIKNVLVRSKRLSADAIINPYALINSAVLEELSKRSTIRLAAGSEQKVNFPALDEAIWTKLRVLGSLNVDPVTFRAGDNLLDDGGNAAVDKIAELLLHNYSGLRVEIRGHTGPGSEAESLALSLERAEVVAKHLSLVHNINATRLHPVGMGFKQPLPRKPNEPTRAYNARLPRVEFVLLEAGSGL